MGRDSDRGSRCRGAPDRVALAHDSRAPGTARAIHRYALALLGLAAAGLGFAWALLDPERQFLHDRLAGTALVEVNRGSAEAGQP